MNPVNRVSPVARGEEEAIARQQNELYTLHRAALKTRTALYGDECKGTVFHRKAEVVGEWDDGASVDLKGLFSKTKNVCEEIEKVPLESISYRGKEVRALSISWPDLEQSLSVFTLQCDRKRYEQPQEQSVWKARFRCIPRKGSDFSFLVELGEADPAENSQPTIESTFYLVDQISKETLLEQPVMKLDCFFSLAKSQRFCRVSIEEPSTLQEDYLRYSKKDAEDDITVRLVGRYIKQSLALLGWGAFSSRDFNISPEELARKKAIQRIAAQQAPVSPAIATQFNTNRSKLFQIWSEVYGESPGVPTPSKQEYLEKVRLGEVEQIVRATPQKYDFYHLSNKLDVFLMRVGAKRLESTESAPVWKAEFRCSATESKGFAAVIQTGEGKPAADAKPILKERFVFNRVLTPAIFEKLTGFTEIKVNPFPAQLESRRFCRVFVEEPAEFRSRPEKYSAEQVKAYEIFYQLAAYVEKELEFKGFRPEDPQRNFQGERERRLQVIRDSQQHEKPATPAEDRDDCVIL